MKDERFEFRIEAESKEYIKHKAKSLNLSVGELVRTSTMYGGSIHIDYSGLNTYARELSSIGNNINQIARALNTMRLENEVPNYDEWMKEIGNIQKQFSDMQDILKLMYKQSKHIHYKKDSENN